MLYRRVVSADRCELFGIFMYVVSRVEVRMGHALFVTDSLARLGGMSKHADWS